jgi:acetylglutamate kinase
MVENIYIIKISGNILDEETKLDSFLRDFSAVGGKKILVHGGGKLATRMASQMGIPQKMIDGRRFTDTDTLKIVTMVYAGFINKDLVARLQALGCDAFGFCGADGNLILAHKRIHPDLDYGYAGDIDRVDAIGLQRLLDLGLVPVIAPITHNGKGQLLNTNADTVAQELGKALSEFFEVTLVYSFEKKGVLLDLLDENSVIPSLRPAEYDRLKKEQKIVAGMIPKIDNAFAALDAGVKQVIIGQAEQLLEMITHDAGTKITHDET